MNKRILAAVLLGAVCSIQAPLFAQQPIEPARVGVVYGEGNPSGTESATGALYDELALDAPETTTLKAKVLEVCPKKGCWMNVQLADKTEVFVKMKDYGFFVPADIEGKTILMEGEAYKELTSVEEQQHYAEDAGKSKAEVASITEPKEKFRFTASNILVVE